MSLTFPRDSELKTQSLESGYVYGGRSGRAAPGRVYGCMIGNCDGNYCPVFHECNAEMEAI